MTTIGNELRQQRFNKKMNAFASVVLLVAFVAVFINFASNLK